MLGNRWSVEEGKFKFLSFSEILYGANLGKKKHMALYSPPHEWPQ